jgi:hypothetical protein
MLKQPRYPLFLVYWFVTIFLLAYVVAWLYASVRATRGAGPGTALTVGLLVGFAAGFPMNLTVATWAPVSRHLPLWWMLDLWLGAIFASLVAGWTFTMACRHCWKPEAEGSFHPWPSGLASNNLKRSTLALIFFFSAMCENANPDLDVAVGSS